MSNEEILNNAPEWATHVDVCDGWATYLASTARHWIDADGDVYLDLNEFMDIRSLADIRRIVELEQERDRYKSVLLNLKRDPSKMGFKINSALSEFNND